MVNIGIVNVQAVSTDEFPRQISHLQTSFTMYVIARQVSFMCLEVGGRETQSVDITSKSAISIFMVNLVGCLIMFNFLECDFKLESGSKGALEIVRKGRHLINSKYSLLV